jgi:hypothetical protein
MTTNTKDNHRPKTGGLRKNTSIVVALALATLVTGGCVSTWSPRDKTLAASYLAAQVVDYGQTNYALENGYSEANPLLGSSPSSGKILAYKGVASALAFWLADRFPSVRTRILSIGLGLQAGVVGSNYRYVGFSMRFTSGGHSGEGRAAGAMTVAPPTNTAARGVPSRGATAGQAVLSVSPTAGSGRELVLRVQRPGYEGRLAPAQL